MNELDGIASSAASGKRLRNVSDQDLLIVSRFPRLGLVMYSYTLVLMQKLNKPSMERYGFDRAIEIICLLFPSCVNNIALTYVCLMAEEMVVSRVSVKGVPCVVQLTRSYTVSVTGRGYTSILTSIF